VPSQEVKRSTAPFVWQPPNQLTAYFWTWHGAALLQSQTDKQKSLAAQINRPQFKMYMHANNNMQQSQW